jgi:hypothetical protein
MRKTIILFLTLWVLHACTEPYDTDMFYELINNSEHKIKIVRFSTASIKDTIVLQAEGKRTFRFSVRTG